MNIALLGYGKMGKTIEEIAIDRGHKICLIVNKDSDPFDFKDCDVAIDFSLPDKAVHNIKSALDSNIPVISGTTGWLDHYDDVIEYCTKRNGTFLYASNFSLGVNIFFEINRHLAKLMAPHKNYNTSIEEIHHTQKLDAPSGTAISLAEDIIKNSDYSSWTLDEAHKNEIGITAKRIPDIPGTHTINYSSEVDHISITHEAHSRKGFALGAIVAAEWINGKKGVFHMKDVLNIG